MQVDTAKLQHALEDLADVHAAIEVQGEQLVVSGIVSTTEEQQAAVDVLKELAPEADIIDNLVVEAVMPEEIGELSLDQSEAAGFTGSTPGTTERESIEPVDFSDQDILKDAGSASGPSGTYADDETDEGDSLFVPPTDPVRSETGEVLGGFQTTSDEHDEIPSSEIVPGPPDEGLIEAVRVELKEDATTTTLDLEVQAQQGIVILRGTVDDIEDAENAQAVAARVQGVVEVRDEIQLRAG